MFNTNFRRKLYHKVIKINQGNTNMVDDNIDNILPDVPPFEYIFGDAARKSGKEFNPDNFLQTLELKSVIKKLREDMAADGLVVDALVGSGRQSFLFSMEGSKLGLIRVDPDLGCDPFDHPLALKPVVRKKYGNYIVSIVPSGVNAEKGTYEDYLRSVAVLEHDGKIGYRDKKGGGKEYFSHFIDASVTQTINLTNEAGEILKYPDGKPIAFLHDLNGLTSDPEKLTPNFGTPKLYNEELIEKMEQARDDLGLADPGSGLERQVQARIKSYRQFSEKGQEIKDDKEFLDHQIEVIKKGVVAGEPELAATYQQADVLLRLRAELAAQHEAGAIKLAPDFLEQLTHTSEWEKKVPTVRRNVGLKTEQAGAQPDAPEASAEVG